MTQSVANRYVTALAEVVTDSDSTLTPEEALDQIQAFGDILEESSELVAVFVSPAISTTQKRGLIAQIGKRIGLSPVTASFLNIVVDHRLIASYRLIVRGFRSWLDAYRNRVEVKVRVAHPIGEAQKAALEGRFRELTGKQVRASYSVESELLGGGAVQIGSTLYDGSLRAALLSLAGDLSESAR